MWDVQEEKYEIKRKVNIIYRNLAVHPTQQLFLNRNFSESNFCIELQYSIVLFNCVFIKNNKF